MEDVRAAYRMQFEIRFFFRYATWQMRAKTAIVMPMRHLRATHPMLSTTVKS